MKEQFKSKQLRMGSYNTTMIMIVTAIVVMINMIVAKLPTQYTQIDVTDNQLYTIGEKTKELVSGLDKDVTLYYICENGSEDDTILRMLEKYEGLSSKIKVVQKDPVVNPSFTTAYTDETVPNNSVIVECGSRYKYISYNDMYETSVDYTTYSMQTTAYDGEGQVTSAIDYVSSDNLPKMYVLQGHHEVTLSDSLKARIEKSNIETQELSLLTEETVPLDCDILMIISPQNDFSDEETEKILNYLDQGGKVFLTSDYTGTEMPNLDRILTHYGLTRNQGLVVESDGSHYYPQRPTYLIPQFVSNEITSTMISENRLVLMPFAQGITVGDAPRDGVNVSELLTTSDSAYAKVNVNSDQIAKEDGDIDGPFALGVAVTEKIEAADTSTADTSTEGTADASTDTATDKEAKLIYFSTSNLLNDTMDGITSGGNYDLITSALSWLGGEAAAVSVEAKSLAYTPLVTTASDVNLWGVILIGVIPAATLLVGIIVWVRRKRR